MARRLTFLVLGLLALSACRLDVLVNVEMDPDGTGIVTVEAVADAGLVAEVPDLIDDLRLEDAIANGWAVDGPTVLADGGVTITLAHDFHSAEELANVLNSVGPPLTQMATARTTQDDQTTNAINGELVLASGFESFADADLLVAVGGLPFAEQFAANGAVPAEVMSVTLEVSLPGELVTAETGTETGEGLITWDAPLDGTSVNLYTATVQRPAGSGGVWAGPLSAISLVLLVVWVVGAAVFIVFVAITRRRKRQRRERGLRRLD